VPAFTILTIFGIPFWGLDVNQSLDYGMVDLYTKNDFLFRGIPRGKMTGRRRKVYLYRHFNAGGALLYVGVTYNPIKRDSVHVKSSEWYSLVASTTLEVHPDWQAGAVAEKSAIAK
jgi:hypothetical protein